MFRITAESCRRFSLAEILIMAALNVEAARTASGPRVLLRTAPDHKTGAVLSS